MEARIFKSENSLGEEVVLRFERPSQKIVSRGDFIYRENFSKAIRAGFMTNAEALKLLQEREIWTEKEEKELAGIRLQVAVLEGKLESADKETGMDIFEKLKSIRYRLNTLNSVRSNILDNTAEQAASEMRTQFYASECVVHDSNGKKVFNDFDDFLGKLDEKIVVDCYRQALISNYEHMFGINVPESFESVLPEDKWLASLDEKEEKPAPQKKKRGRKKKTQSS